VWKKLRLFCECTRITQLARFMINGCNLLLLLLHLKRENTQFDLFVWSHLVFYNFKFEGILEVPLVFILFILYCNLVIF